MDHNCESLHFIGGSPNLVSGNKVACRFLILVLATLGTAIADESQAASPPPAALLRGAEMSRLKHRSVTVRFQEISTHHEYGQLSRTCEVEMSDDKIRFDTVLKGRGAETVIRVADEFISYHREKNTDVVIFGLNMAGGERTDYIFDPRSLGLDHDLSKTLQVQQCFWYDQVDSPETMGVEYLRDAETWKIKVVRGDATKFYWIEEPSFRVHRVVLETSLGTNTIESEFEETQPGSVFPNLVTSRFEYKDGASHTKEFRIQKFDVDVKIDDGRFTYATMDLPVGTSLADYRIQRVIGFWDGNAVSTSRPANSSIPRSPAEPLVAPTASGLSRRSWILIANALVLVVVGIVILWCRR